jgi:hypothetical protein
VTLKRHRADNRFLRATSLRATGGAFARRVFPGYVDFLRGKDESQSVKAVAGPITKIEDLRRDGREVRVRTEESSAVVRRDPDDELWKVV